MKNKDLKAPDKYTLGVKRKFSLGKYIIKKLILAVLLVIGIATIIIVFSTSEYNYLPLLSIPLIILIILSQIYNFKKYYKKTTFRKNSKLKSADKSSLYSNGTKYRISNDSKNIVLDNYFIAETGIHKLVQVIRGKSSYYVHYLKISDDGIGFLEDSLITDFDNIDTCKKYNSKDYRINFSSLRSIEYSDISAENTVLENSGAIMFDLAEKSKWGNKFFYPVAHINDKYIYKFFGNMKMIIRFSDNTKGKISYIDALKKLSNTRLTFIILKNGYYISTVLSFCAPNYRIRSIFSIANIILPLIILIFYCLNNGEYSLNDVKHHEGGSEFSEHPSLTKVLYMPLFLNVMPTFFMNVTEWPRFFIFSLTASAVIAIILMIVAADKRAILSVIMIALALSFTSVSELNRRFDFKEPIVYNSTILNKHHSPAGHRRLPTYYVEVKLKNQETAELRISASRYADCDISDTVEVYEYSGFLDIPYIELRFE